MRSSSSRSPTARPTAAPAEAVEAVEVNLVVAPGPRGAGVGRRLAETVLEAFPASELSAWSHTNHPAAARLAGSLGFARVRDLWVMRRSLSDDAAPLPAVVTPAGVVVRTFEPAATRTPSSRSTPPRSPTIPSRGR